MKKIYVLATALLLGASTQAQQTVDFESFTLAADTFDNGSAGNGDFLLGTDQIRFSNEFTPNNWGGSWTGYSISNMSDVTTAGIGNQYSVFTGSGYDGSSNFAIGYSSGLITCENEYQFIDSFKITNTTYTAISMRDGDSFGKEFGSLNNAAGDPDGTNGEDFYRVWVICEDYAQTQKDSIEVLLADYRFADNTQDYIVEEWLNVDVQSVGFMVNKISIRMESSDNHPQYGMNTPAYYAIDNVVSSFPLGLEENELLSINAFPNPVEDKLTVKGEEGVLTIIDLSGSVILSKEHKELSILDLSNLNNGVYILSVTNSSGKFTQKIVK